MTPVTYRCGSPFRRRAGHKVVEVNRPDCRLWRMNGKSDTLDADNAACSVLAG